LLARIKFSSKLKVSTSEIGYYSYTNRYALYKKMKKTLGKPENWQDFESLSKKLWGEIWGIPHKIKKNGRLGQVQAGIDIYGIPKGLKKYWGIQCKGKDDYSKAKLTKKEINIEIDKAKKFKPELGVYIIASTSNKDAKIEEYIRLKDIENQNNGSFEILLFCWEDIVDLIEENQDILYWYLNGISQKGKFDFKISFNNFLDTLVINPTFEKRIIRHQLKSINTNNRISLGIYKSILEKREVYGLNHLPSFFGSNKINKSWCEFDLIMENIGTSALDDWRFEIKFIKGVKSIDDSNPYFPNVSIPTYVDDENKTIRYRPRDNSPLIQKDNISFEIPLMVEFNAKKVIAEWEFLARDYSKKETIEFVIEPKYIETLEIIEVESENELIEDQFYILEYIIDKE